MRIRTKYKTNAKGTGQIVARTSDMQRTVTYDQSKSSTWNHAAAAGTLMRAKWGRVGEPALSDLLSKVTDKSNESGTEHVFEV